VRLSWLPWNAVTVAGNLQLPDYRFVKLSFSRTLRSYAAGSWDQLQVTFEFKRLYGYYIVQVGGPIYVYFWAFCNFNFNE
jgi:hypothetical protein